MADGAKVTARDVAVRAGVSAGTVSKALSGRGSVHPDTRDRIFRIADELGLRRSGGARELTVGILTWDLHRRRTSPVLLGALETLADRDAAFMICDGRGDPIRERHFVDTLLRRHVDGILVMAGGSGSFTRSPLEGVGDVPVVYARASSSNSEDISVVADDRGAVEQAVRHLLATGRRHLACLLGPANEDSAALKVKTVGDVLEENGLKPAIAPLFGTWTEEWGRQGALEMMHRAPDVDGIICANDVIARGAVRGLEAADVIVPDDVGVVGFDNWDVIVEGSSPRLTSLDLNLEQIGRTAAERLVHAILDRKSETGLQVIASTLVPRESTAVAVRRKVTSPAEHVS